MFDRGLNLRKTLLALLVSGAALTACGNPDLPTTVADRLPTPTFVAAPSGSASASASASASSEASVAPTASASASSAPIASESAAASASAAPSAAGDVHPVAQEIADEFGVSAAEVEGWHDQGIGYGILAQFYSMAYGRCGTSATTGVDQLVAMKQSGMGMGEIRKQVLGTAAANECSLGKLKQDDLDRADAGSQPVADEGDDDQGKPDDKANQGQSSDDHGKANDDHGKANDDHGNSGKSGDDHGKADDKGKGKPAEAPKPGNNGNGGDKGKGKGKDK